MVHPVPQFHPCRSHCRVGKVARHGGQFHANRPRFGDHTFEGTGGSATGDLNPCRAPSSASEGGSCPLHAWFGPSRTRTVDGGPPGGSPRGPQFRRHSSHFGTDFQVEGAERLVVACCRNQPLRPSCVAPRAAPQETSSGSGKRDQRNRARDVVGRPRTSPVTQVDPTTLGSPLEWAEASDQTCRGGH